MFIQRKIKGKKTSYIGDAVRISRGMATVSVYINGKKLTGSTKI
jgi:hypothetical protein